MTPDDILAQAAAELDFPLDGEIRIGGNYRSVVRDGTTAYVSGQVPRVGETIVVTGRVGAGVELAQAQHAARICALRALVLLQRELGSLSAIRQVLRLNVYVQCAEGFTQISEVGDGASDLLARVLGEAGPHSRTSVGVLALPKNASVEVDMVVATRG